MFKKASKHFTCPGTAAPTPSPSPLPVHDVTEPELLFDELPCTSTLAPTMDEMLDLLLTFSVASASAMPDASLNNSSFM